MGVYSAFLKKASVHVLSANKVVRPSAEFVKAINWFMLRKVQMMIRLFSWFFLPPVGRYYPGGGRHGATCQEALGWTAGKGGVHVLDRCPDCAPKALVLHPQAQLTSTSCRFDAEIKFICREIAAR